MKKHRHRWTTEVTKQGWVCSLCIGSDVPAVVGCKSQGLFVGCFKGLCARHRGIFAKRGFASIPKEILRELAARGGRHAHQNGTAYRLTPEKAREAGRKGGRVTSKDRAHMATIGQLGAYAVHHRKKNHEQEGRL